MSELDTSLAEQIARKKDEIFRIIALAYCDYAINKVEIKEHLGAIFESKDVANAYCNDDRFAVEITKRIKIKDPITKVEKVDFEIIRYNVFRLFHNETSTVTYFINNYEKEASYLLPLVECLYKDGSVDSNGFNVELKEFSPKKLFKKGSYKATLTKKPIFIDLEKYALQELDKRGLCLKFIKDYEISFVEQDEKVLDNWDSKAEYIQDLKDQTEGYELLESNSQEIADNSSVYKTQEEAIKDIAGSAFIQAAVFDKKLIK